MGKVIVGIKGGLGNQLFCYAAARRLACVNKAELVIDNVTGFARDRQYRRKYMLDKFHIPVRKATAAERMEPFERYRRGLAKWFARRAPFEKRRYIEQEGRDFDPRLLHYKVRRTVYLDGYWQGEGYFKDIEQVIRNDLRIIPPEDETNQRLAAQIRQWNAVAIHVRWFDPPPSRNEWHSAAVDYYHRAMAEIERRVEEPVYVLFSDQPDAAVHVLNLSSDRLLVADHNQGDENAYADLWLMTLCKHFIITNSTFSWWGAWLSEYRDKIVIAPGIKLKGIGAWGFKGLIPEGWLTL